MATPSPVNSAPRNMDSDTNAARIAIGGAVCRYARLEPACLFREAPLVRRRVISVSHRRSVSKSQLPDAAQSPRTLAFYRQAGLASTYDNIQNDLSSLETLEHFKTMYRTAN